MQIQALLTIPICNWSNFRQTINFFFTLDPGSIGSGLCIVWYLYWGVIMAAKNVKDRFRFTDGLIDYLQEVDYRLATKESDRREIFKFRYQSFLRDKALAETDVDFLTDDYDQMDNCWLFGIHYNQKLASSVRIHLVTPQKPYSPSVDVFPDFVRPMLDKGYRIVDPSKFVSDASATNSFPVLPFLTFRLACMASDFFDADYCLVSVSEVHSSFYQRIFGLTPVCEPRPYPQLKTPICLMQANVAELWDVLIKKYPVFGSTFTERRMLFERSDIVVPGEEKISTDIMHEIGKNRLN